MLTPRRILMTVDAVGGVWRYAVDLAESLADLGVETVLLGFGPPPTSDQRREAERLAGLEWSDLPLDWMEGGPDRLAAVPGVIADHARRVGADAIHLNQPSQAAGLEVDVPVIAVAHSCVTSWFRIVRGSGLPEDWVWRGALTAQGLTAATKVVAPSQAHADVIAACYAGLGSADRVEVVPNATVTRPPAASRRRYAYAAGRWWDEGKNAAVLDAAAAGSELPVLAAGAVRGPDGQHVRFRHARELGRVPASDMVPLAAEAWAFVSPSLYEPFGLAALEAAGAGTALVLSDIPTYRETWDGAALFADPHDPEAFAAALNDLAADSARRDALAAEAAQRAAQFTPEAQARRMLDLYRQPSPRAATEVA